MNLVGIMPVRNEDWILSISARVALMWCDRLVILNHASTDGTWGILGELSVEFGKRVIIQCVESQQWDEMEHRQILLGWARHNGTEVAPATHIALIDADEILTGNLLGNIREQIARLNTGQMLTLPLYNLRGGLNRYHLNGIWGQRVTSVAFKDVDTAGWKGGGQHHREPHGVNWQSVNLIHQGAGGVMHLWGASERRLIARHALYKVREILKPVENRDYKAVEQIEQVFSWAIKGEPTKPQHPRWGVPETWTYADVPEAWWTAIHHGIGANLQAVDLNAEPWQEAEVRRLVAEHGRERFAGLDLFGVA